MIQVSPTVSNKLFLDSLSKTKTKPHNKTILRSSLSRKDNSALSTASSRRYNTQQHPLQEAFDLTVKHLKESAFKDMGLVADNARQQIDQLAQILQTGNHEQVVRQVEAVLNNESLNNVREPEKKLGLYFLARLASVISHDLFGTEPSTAYGQIPDLISTGNQFAVFARDTSSLLNSGLALMAASTKPSTSLQASPTISTSAIQSQQPLGRINPYKSSIVRISSQFTGPLNISQDIQIPTTGGEVSTRSNQFHLDWFSRSVSQTPKGEDVVLGNTMHEVLSALALFGAQGQTQADLLRFLRLGNSANAQEIQALAQAFRQSVNVLPQLNPQTRKFDYSSAAGLFVRESWMENLNPDFETPYSQTFGAEVYPMTTQEFQRWAHEKTRGLVVPNIRLDGLDKLILATANVFESQLSRPFTSSDMDTFRTGSGNSVRLPIMHQNSKLKYGQQEIGGQLVKIAELPYLTGDLERYKGYIILPEDLAELAKHLDMNSLQSLITGISEHQLDLRLPRFESKTTQNTKQVLSSAEEMGLPLSGECDFLNLTALHARAATDNQLRIGQIQHDALLRQTETKTQAASVSTVVMRGKGIEAPSPRAELHATKPFIFVITDPHRDNKSPDNQIGRILFTAAVQNPSAIEKSDLDQQAQIGGDNRRTFLGGDTPGGDAQRSLTDRFDGYISRSGN
ncbi:MAG: serpin family protein [Candidatus Caenarcaniphilales bacterium]|nr:serpin family protein [Candidatus Caenarcaniphilales bacterium]